MDRFNLTIDDVSPGMQKVTETNVYWWAYLYWTNELNHFTSRLKTAKNNDDIGYCRYCIVEAKKIILDLHKKLISMPEFKGYEFPTPDWADTFLKSKQDMGPN